MTIGKTKHPYSEEDVPEGKRLRMKDWLTSRIGNPRYPGLVWLDEKRQMFRIPWKHAALHGWNEKSDNALFRDWAEHTGACVHNSHPKQLKATFRCALHSLPDVHEDKERARKKGDDACRVYIIDNTSPHKSMRRHIRIRGHKEKDRLRKIGMRREDVNRLPYEEMTKIQRSLGPQQTTESHYNNWSDSMLTRQYHQNANRNNNNNSNFDLPARLQHNNVLTKEFSAMHRAWTTKSNPDIPAHEFLPPPVNTSCLYQNTFPASQHSLSVSDISNSYFTNAQHMYETTMPTPNNMQGYEYYTTKSEAYEQDMLPFNPHTLSPVSPGSMSFSPSCSSMTPSPVHSLQSTSYVAGSPGCGQDTVAQVFANAAAVMDDFKMLNNNEFSSESSVFGEEKFLTSVEALIASGAVQQNSSRTSVISEPMTAAHTSALSAMQCQNANNNTRNLSFEDYNHRSSTSASLSNMIERSQSEICQTVSMVNSQTRQNQMLGSVSPQCLSPQHNEYRESNSPMNQYVTENGTKSPVSGWIASPQHESMLPSASTLLSSNSPTSKRAPLHWIPSSGDEGQSPPDTNNIYNLMQYEAISNSSPPSYYSTQGSVHGYIDHPVIPISSSSYTHQASPAYGGYPHE